MEVIELIVSTVTPLIVFILGVFFLRKTEGIRRSVARTAEFESKWADGFYNACSEFMKKVERYMALLSKLQILNDMNGELGTRYQQELTSLNPGIQECELKIR